MEFSRHETTQIKKAASLSSLLRVLGILDYEVPTLREAYTAHESFGNNHPCTLHANYAERAGFNLEAPSGALPFMRR